MIFSTLRRLTGKSLTTRLGLLRQRLYSAIALMVETANSGDL